MEENYCPIENKYDRLAIIYIINLMSDELDKIESDKFNKNRMWGFYVKKWC